MQTEIERKFLVASFDGWLVTSTSFLKQGYVAIDKDGTEVRIRSINDEIFMLTVKQGSGLTRNECEFELTYDQFNQLWSLTYGKRIAKKRAVLVENQNRYEIDVYLDELEGLTVVEVEFGCEDEAVQFVPPDWFGKEVTHDNRYKNQNLAVSGVPNT